MRTHRRTVAVLAGPGIRAARDVYTTVPADAIRVAALVEIAAAAASLARTVVRLRRLDPDLIAPHVADIADLRAVLGRGRWLPTMTRHVPAPATGSVTVTETASGLVPRPRSVRRRMARTARPVAQDALFQISA
ncbi:hypothetical protein Aca07nite_19490 [Actinoplanes capillaceus]|uniref:Uncharacterized protein n=1 Tax=Actinoplanes campanulatus TaxID=113559 RepID=A0ABQ3WCC0_9ACTN|nr:hypothetical protein [Actinoplanes capillaceus]GID44674.1 hypothetical protein Aca07nite_19490 [Actinoplanes capillaceus]